MLRWVDLGTQDGEEANRVLEMNNHRERLTTILNSGKPEEFPFDYPIISLDEDEPEPEGIISPKPINNSIPIIPHFVSLNPIVSVEVGGFPKESEITKNFEELD